MKSKIHDKTKALFMTGRDWSQEPPHWGGFEPVKMAAVLTAFAPYLFITYDCFFVEVGEVICKVTCISDQGIRIEPIEPPEDYNWVHIADIEKSKLVKQPSILELMEGGGPL